MDHTTVGDGQTPASKIPFTAADMNWRWGSFGGSLMLVTDGGGAKVIMCTGRTPRTASPPILTRDPATGVLRPLRPDDAVAHLSAAAPGLYQAAALGLQMAEKYAEEELKGAGPLYDEAMEKIFSIRSAMARARGEAA